MSEVTIAIPTYKRGEILVQTIEHLLKLAPRATEILIVDQTELHRPEIVERLHEWSQNGDIRWIRVSEPSVPHAMNIALREARAPIVLFMDDDIVPTDNLVAEHTAGYDAGIWAVAGQVLQPGEEEGHFEHLHDGPLRDLEFPFNHNQRCDVENVMAGNLSVHRGHSLSIGGFDENFIGAAYRFETDFARRMIAAGGRIRYEPRARLRHLKITDGGIRAHGDQRRTVSASHTVGDYYFALWHVRRFWPYVLRRLRRNVVTRWLLWHPWYIPSRLIAEVRGYAIAKRLYRRGRLLME